MKETGKHLFESGLERLEEISSLLDTEGIPLEETLALYEEGTKLAASLGTYLETAERRIMVAPIATDAAATSANTVADCTPLATADEPPRKTGRTRRATPSTADKKPPASGDDLFG